MGDLDLQIAADNFATAGSTWAIEQLTPWLIGGNPDVSAVTDAYIEMRCAAAIYGWELTRSLRACLERAPGPVYDDETLAELLGGVR